MHPIKMIKNINRFFLAAALGILSCNAQAMNLVAVPDTATTTQNTPISIPALANDSGNGIFLSFVHAWTENGGQTSIVNGKIQYTPPQSFTGVDSFWYTISDGNSNYSSKVTVTVTQGVGSITAVADAVTTSKNRPVSIPALDNDVGAGIQISFVHNWTPQGGQTSIVNGEILYQPSPNFTGVDTFWYTISDGNLDYSAQIAVTVGEFEILNMHADVLSRAKSIDWENSPPRGTGLVETIVTNGAWAGSIQLTVTSTDDFAQEQLITYLASDNQYYSTSIKNISGSIIALNKPLVKSLQASNKIWNFYGDPNHPNQKGYRALADYAVRSLNNLDQGKHVLLGDSWFGWPGDIALRLAQRLPNATIVNKGIGGHDSSQLLERFDRDVGPEQPDVVWIMTGTNDYFRYIPASAYKENMRQMISKIKELGARAIVFNSSISSPDDRLLLSKEYVDVLDDLLETY